jgi:pimeloyl-ACP methyl ester carboxylesterase
MEPQAPRRTTHAQGGPANRLVYDRWGRFGRPVLLLHGLFFDRTMWWPVAAELAALSSCTVLAPDLPGHGDSAARAHDDLQKLAFDLAALVQSLDLHRAPIVVGHAESVRLADAFGDRFATHRVLTADQLGDGSADVPACFRPYARRRADPELRRAYASWNEQPRSSSFPHLADPVGFAAGLSETLV